MSYSAQCPPLSAHEAETFGRWLGVYQIAISGLRVWHIGASGRTYQSQPLADTVLLAVGQTAASLGSGSAGAMVGAAAGPGCLALLAPVATLLAPIIVPLTLGAIALQPIALAADHRHRKRSAETVASVVRDDPIVATKLQFGVTGVSDKRRAWTEYLIAIYAAQHQWYDVRGFTHPAQLAVGARYAAAHPGQYPRPWSETPRGTSRTSAKTAAAPTRLGKVGRFFEAEPDPRRRK